MPAPVHGDAPPNDVLMCNNSNATVSSSGVYTGDMGAFPPPAVNADMHVLIFPVVIRCSRVCRPHKRGRSVHGEGWVNTGRTPMTVDEDVNVTNMGGERQLVHCIHACGGDVMGRSHVSDCESVSMGSYIEMKGWWEVEGPGCCYRGGSSVCPKEMDLLQWGQPLHSSTSACLVRFLR